MSFSDIDIPTRLKSLHPNARGRDTTGNNQIEEESESEKRLRTLVELAPDGIITISLKGYVTSINSAYSKLTGYSNDEIVGKHFTKLNVLKMRDIPKMAKMFSSWILGKEPEPLEFEYVHKDGSNKWGEAHFKIIRISLLKREMIGILRDVTDRKQSEEKMKNLMEELERSNSELDDYTYAVSHDLKAPLRTIEAFGNFLLDDYSDKLDDEGREYVRRMSEASIRMKNLIDDLLLISRVGRKNTEITRVDFNQLLQEIIDDFETVINERSAEIVVDDLPTLFTQRVWMKQLFSNLINNGIKFNNSKTPTIKVKCEEGEGELIFSVEDNGIGIDKKYHEQIFKIFQRLHTQDEYPGSGAGLTICKKIIDSYGGRIWLDSKPGKGTTFYFTHPKESPTEDDSLIEAQRLDQLEYDLPSQIE